MQSCICAPGESWVQLNLAKIVCTGKAAKVMHGQFENGALCPVEGEGKLQPRSYGNNH